MHSEIKDQKSDNDKAQALAAMIAQKRDLDVRAYPGEILQKALEDNQRITFQLSLKISSQQVPYYMKGLRHNGTIQLLSLADNDLHDDDITLISKALPDTISSLNLSKNSIGDQGFNEIAKLIRHNEKISILDLRTNNLSEKGAIALFSALKNNRTMDKMLLDFGRLNENSKKFLLEILKKNKKLKVITENSRWEGYEFKSVCNQWPNPSPLDLAISKQLAINAYVYSYHFHFSNYLLGISYVKNQIIKKQIPTTGPLGILEPKNLFENKPLRVQIKYLEEKEYKNFLLLDWQLLLPPEHLSETIHYFYEVLLQLGLKLHAWTGSQYCEIQTENIQGLNDLHSFLNSIGYTSACASEEKIKDQLSKVLDINAYILLDFLQVRTLLKNSIPYQKRVGTIDSGFLKSLHFDPGMLSLEFCQSYLAQSGDKVLLDRIINSFHLPGIKHFDRSISTLLPREDLLKLLQNIPKLKSLILVVQDEKDFSTLESLTNLSILGLEINDERFLIMLEKTLGNFLNLKLLKLTLINTQNLSLFSAPAIRQSPMKLDLTIKFQFDDYPLLNLSLLNDYSLVYLTLEGLTIDFSEFKLSKLLKLNLRNNVYRNLDPITISNAFDQPVFISSNQNIYVVPSYKNGLFFRNNKLTTFEFEIELLKHLFPTISSQKLIKKSTLPLDLDTGEDDGKVCQRDQWYIDEKGGFNLSYNCLKVFNTVYTEGDELKFGIQITGLEKLVIEPSPGFFNEFNQTLLKKVVDQCKPQLPDSKFYLAKIKLDLSGDSSAGLGLGKMILPGRSLFDEIIMFSCSNPSLEFKFKRTIPTRQLLIQIIMDEEKISEINQTSIDFYYIAVSLPPSPFKYSDAQFGKQTTDEIDQYFKTLESLANNPLSALSKRYPNFSRFWQKIKVMLNDRHLSMPELGELISIYCSTDKKGNSIRGFTAQETNPENFSDFMDYLLPPGLNVLSNFYIRQRGACRHSGQAFAMQVAALKMHKPIHWLLIKSDNHLVPVMIYPDKNYSWQVKLYPYLHGIRGQYEIKPLILPEKPSKITGTLPQKQSEEAKEPQIERKVQPILKLSDHLKKVTETLKKNKDKEEKDKKAEILTIEARLLGSLFGKKTPVITTEMKVQKTIEEASAQFSPLTHWAFTCKTLDEYLGNLMRTPNPLLTYHEPGIPYGLLLGFSEYLQRKYSNYYLNYVTSSTELLGLLHNNEVTKQGEYFHEQPGQLPIAVAKDSIIIILINWSLIKEERIAVQSILDSKPKLGDLNLKRFIPISMMTETDNTIVTEKDFTGRCEQVPIPGKILGELQKLSKIINYDNLCTYLHDDNKTVTGKSIAPLEGDPYWESKLIGRLQIDENGKIFSINGPLIAASENKEGAASVVLQNPSREKEDYNGLKHFWMKLFALKCYWYNNQQYTLNWLAPHEGFQLYQYDFRRQRPDWLPLLQDADSISAWSEGRPITEIVFDKESMKDFLPSIIMKENIIVSTAGRSILEADENSTLLIEVTFKPLEQEWQRFWGALLPLYQAGKLKAKMAISIKKPFEQKSTLEIPTHYHIIETNQPLSALLAAKQKGKIGKDSQIVFLNGEIIPNEIIDQYKMTMGISGEIPHFSRTVQSVAKTLIDGGEVVLVALSKSALSLELFYQLKTILHGRYLWLNGEYIPIKEGRLILIVYKDDQYSDSLFHLCCREWQEFNFSDYQLLLKEFISGTNWQRLACFVNLIQDQQVTMSITLCAALLENISAASWSQIEPLINAITQATGSELVAYRQVLAKLLFCLPQQEGSDGPVDDKTIQTFDEKMPDFKIWQTLSAYSPQILAEILQVNSWQAVTGIFRKEISFAQLSAFAFRQYYAWSHEPEPHGPEIKAPAENSLMKVNSILKRKHAITLMGPPGAGKSHMLKELKKFLEAQGYRVKIYLGQKAIPTFLAEAKSDHESKTPTFRFLQLDEPNLRPKDFLGLIFNLYHGNLVWQPEHDSYAFSDYDKVVITGNFANSIHRYPLPDFLDTLFFKPFSPEFILQRIIFPNLDLPPYLAQPIGAILLAGYQWLQQNLSPHLEFSPRNIQDAMASLNLRLQRTPSTNLPKLKAMTVGACYRRFSGFLTDPNQHKQLKDTLCETAGITVEPSNFEPLTYPKEEQFLRKSGLNLPPSALKLAREIFEAFDTRDRIGKGTTCFLPGFVVEGEPGWGKSTLIEACLKSWGFVDGASPEAKRVPPRYRFYKVNMSQDAEALIKKVMPEGGIILFDEINAMHPALEELLNLVFDLVMTGKDQLQYHKIEDWPEQSVNVNFMVFGTGNSSKYDGGRKKLSGPLVNRVYFTYVNFDSNDLVVIAKEQNHPYPELLVACFEALLEFQKARGKTSDFRDYRKIIDFNLKLLHSHSSRNPSQAINLTTHLNLMVTAIVAITSILLPKDQQITLNRQILKHSSS